MSKPDAMAQDEEQPSRIVKDLGLTTLHQPRDEQSVTADLVFVHGLQGHPRRTWQSLVTPQPHTSISKPFKMSKKPRKDKEEAGMFWPADLLPQDFPTLRVLTYGYDSHVTRGYTSSGTSKDGILDHGNSLLNALIRERTNLSNRPIIFVAHSLGGLVVKQTLVEARKRVSSSHIHNIYTSAYAVIFFGTPHRGSDSASWGLMASNLLKAAQISVNDAILRDLKPSSGSSKLFELRRDFNDVLEDSRQRNPLQLYTFQEELGMTSLKALGGKVVTSESSSFDSPSYGYDSIHANHMNMCRFTGLEDDGYRKFGGVLSTYVQELVGRRASDEQAERRAQQESLDELMKNLDFAERSSRENQLQNLDTDQSTFGWIWSSAFADWLSSSKTLFWLRGKPASGKSTLTQYLVHHDKTYSKLRECQNGDWLRIYFFFDFRAGTGMRNNFEGLLRSLLVQLLYAMPGMKKYAPPESDTHWHEARLRQCLVSAFDHSPKSLCVFIDGLDEYAGDLLQLLRFLKSLQTVGETPRSPRKIYISSRPEPVPSELLKGTPSLSMSEENGPGIRSYVHSIMNDVLPKIAENPQWGYLRDEIVERADRVFLWVRFALKELIQGFCDGDSIREASDRLEKAPDELEGIYKRIIDRIEHLARNEALSMLKIACFTPADLSLQDFLVAIAFAMETDLSIRRSISYSELERFSKRVHGKVGGLLEIIKVEEEPLSNARVKLTHRTVETFLEKYGWQLLQPQRPITRRDGYLFTLVICIEYLKKILGSFNVRDRESPVANYVFSNTKNESLYPLFAYSACNLYCLARRFELSGNISSHVFIKEVPRLDFGPVHAALVSHNPHYTSCLCSLIYDGHKFEYDPTSAFAHGLPETCDDLICRDAGVQGFPIDEALNDAIIYSSMPCYEANFLNYNLRTIALVMDKIIQIKQSHVARAVAIPAPTKVLRLLFCHPSIENLEIVGDDGRKVTLLWLLVSAKVRYGGVARLVLLVKTLIDMGEDVNKRCGPHGTPLDYVVRLELSDAQTDLAFALTYCGAYVTMNPGSLSKPINFNFPAPSTKRTCISLEKYLKTSIGPGRANSN